MPAITSGSFHEASSIGTGKHGIDYSANLMQLGRTAWGATRTWENISALPARWKAMRKVSLSPYMVRYMTSG